MPLLLLAYLAFVSIALPDGLTGVAWPGMRAELNQPVEALGLLLPFAIGASMIAGVSTGFVLSRVGVGRLLAVSTFVSAVALTGQATAPTFWIVIAWVSVASLGSGAIDTGLNAYAARNFTARHITWMHACYGLGAAAGPLIVAGTAAAGLSWRWAFGIVAAVHVPLLVAFAVTARSWGAPAAPAHAPGAAAAEGGHRAMWLSAAVVALQTGVEATTALWAYVYLTGARGVPAEPAAFAVSAYWLALVLGRIVLGPVADRIGARRVLTGALAGLVAGAVLTALPGYAAIAGIVLVGVAAAPVFPLLTLTTRDRVGERLADRAVGVQGAASAAGSAVLPALVGVLIGRSGAGVLAWCLIGLAAATAAAYTAAVARTRVTA